MDRRIAALALLALSACGGSSSSPFQPPPAYVEPHASPAACAAPTLVGGGTSGAADPGTGCVRAVQPSALPAVAATVAHGWVDLGEHTVGTVVPFDVPAGTASITLIEQVVSAAERVVFHFPDGSSGPEENAAVLAELRDPAGSLIHTDIRLGVPPDGSATPLFLASYSAVTGSLTYPNTSAGLQTAGGGVAAGRWTAQVGDYAYECALAGAASPPPPLRGLSCDPPLAGVTPFAEGRYRLFLLTRPAAPAGAAIPATGTLDLDIHLVDVPAPGQLYPFTAAGAPGHAVAQRLVESTAALLANAGICLGTVTFLDAPAWARTRFGSGISDADLSACGEFSQLLTLSVPGRRTLDLFLVTRITTLDPRFSTLGIDGTIPGPATVNGTVTSGAIVSAEDLGAGLCPGPGGAPDLARCGTDEVAYVAAHEAGHFLGLYHTTEASGAEWDPLASTPRCLCSCSATCATGLVSSGCVRSNTCGGGQNLMFWLLDPLRSRGYLTGEQGQVARASPLLR